MAQLEANNNNIVVLYIKHELCKANSWIDVWSVQQTKRKCGYPNHWQSLYHRHPRNLYTARQKANKDIQIDKFIPEILKLGIRNVATNFFF